MGPVMTNTPAKSIRSACPRRPGIVLAVPGPWPLRLELLLAPLFAVASLLFSGAPALADSCPNAQFRTGYSASLPDCRAYELVTPADKGDGALPLSLSAIGSVQATQAAADGDGLGYGMVVAIPGSGSQTGASDDYLARRGASGWTSEGLIPPQATLSSLAVKPAIIGFSSDLSKTALADGGGATTPGGFGQDDPPLVPGEPADNQNLFIRDNTSGTWQLADITPAGVTPTTATFDGASADFSQVIFDSTAALTSDAISGSSNLYDWAGGQLSLVSQEPSGSAAECGGSGPACTPVAGAIVGNGGATVSGYLNAVSSDGSTVAFEASPLSGGPQKLDLRIHGERTVVASASQKTNGSGPGGTDPNGPQPATYWWLTPDGSQVIFSSCEQLTNDSTAVSVPGGCNGQDLYEYDTATGALTDLTVDPNAATDQSCAGQTATGLCGADVQGVLGASADGSYVYFTANGVLANGASAGTFPNGTAVTNLYVWHDGVTSFIAQLAGADSQDWDGHFTARVSSGGATLAFMASTSPTGYDNTDAVTGQPDSEVYLYDATTRTLTCASCNPSGAQPLGPSSIDPVRDDLGSGFGSNLGFYLPRNLSADGSRLFFDSYDALVPADSNGYEDVYEYEDGAPRLVSSGTGDGPSAFIDASVSGNDVFLSTLQSLVPADTDQEPDIYDARVDGGSPPPAPTPPACSGEDCKPPAPAAPSPLTAGTIIFSGPGNVSAQLHVGSATLRVLAISASERAAFARTGTLGLRVRASTGGRVTASVTARMPARAGGRLTLRIVMIAHATRVLARGGEATLTLRLSAAARAYLAAHGALAVEITVTSPRVRGAQRASFLLRDTNTASRRRAGR
jgi:hypothetical protein